MFLINWLICGYSSACLQRRIDEGEGIIKTVQTYTTTTCKAAKFNLLSSFLAVSYREQPRKATKPQSGDTSCPPTSGEALKAKVRKKKKMDRFFNFCFSLLSLY